MLKTPTIAPLAAAIHWRLHSRDARPVIVSTYHKALTVLFSRILRSAALLSARRFSSGRTNTINWDAHFILDHHSEVDHMRFPDYQGIHITRDPRDMLVSCAFYHQRADEPWLLQPYAEFGGLSYRDQARSFGTDIESLLLFELDNAAGQIIAQMAAWPETLHHVAEFRYEDLIDEGASTIFERGLALADFDPRLIPLLTQLFDNFKLGGRWAARKHIRNPEPGQHLRHMTERVDKRFQERFPGLLKKLGYEA